VSSDQFDLPPRDRIIPEDQSPGEPAELSLEDAQRLNEERVKRASEYDNLSGRSGGRDGAKPSSRSNDKPWPKSSAKPEYRSQSRSESKSPWKPQPKTSSDAAVKNAGPANLDPWASSRNKFK